MESNCSPRCLTTQDMVWGCPHIFMSSTWMVISKESLPFSHVKSCWSPWRSVTPMGVNTFLSASNQRRGASRSPNSGLTNTRISVAASKSSYPSSAWRRNSLPGGQDLWTCLNCPPLSCSSSNVNPRKKASDISALQSSHPCCTATAMRRRCDHRVEVPASVAVSCLSRKSCATRRAFIFLALKSPEPISFHVKTHLRTLVVCFLLPRPQALCLTQRSSSSIMASRHSSTWLRASWRSKMLFAPLPSWDLLAGEQPYEHQIFQGSHVDDRPLSLFPMQWLPCCEPKQIHAQHNEVNSHVPEIGVPPTHPF